MNTESTTETTENVSNHRRNGNIARLPKALRDKINSLIDDGIEYPDIIQALGEEGQHLQPSNFTHWKNGGYQDYLRDQAWRDRIDATNERYMEVGMRDGATLAAGGLYAATTQICKLMDQLAKENPDEKDAERFSRITNTLSRLSRSILTLQQYRDQVAEKKAELEAAAKMTDAKGGLPPEIVKQIQIAIAGL